MRLAQGTYRSLLSPTSRSRCLYGSRSNGENEERRGQALRSQYLPRYAMSTLEWERERDECAELQTGRLFIPSQGAWHGAAAGEGVMWLVMAISAVFLVSHILQLAVELTDMLRGQPERSTTISDTLYSRIESN